MCVCIKLSFLQGKTKIYIHTELSESDINDNDEIPGHRNGSVVQLLARRRKETLRRILPGPPPPNASSAPALGLNFVLRPERPLVVTGPYAGRFLSGLTLTSPHCVLHTVVHGRVLSCHAAQ